MPDSEATPQPTAQRQSGNVFLRKLGPLPLWAWMGVGLGIALAYYYWRKNKAAASSSASGNTGGATGSPSGGTAGGTATSSLIPQFVNQVYNQPSPPPDVTVNNNTTNNTPASAPVVQQKRPDLPGYPAPSDFEGWKVSGTSIGLSWHNVDPQPGSYTWVVKDSQGNQKQGTTQGTNVTVSGLKPHTGYSVGVYATGGNGTKTGDPTYSYVQT